MMAPTLPQRPRREPLFDFHPLTGIGIEVFYADRSLETFGRCGAGRFWWPRRRGCSPAGSPIGPFATSYAAYRNAMSSGGAGRSADENLNRERTQLRSRCFPRASPEWKRQGRLSAACQNLFRYREKLERAKGFEPSTPTLARSCSTPELHPHPLRLPESHRHRPAELCQMPSPNATAPSGPFEEGIGQKSTGSPRNLALSRPWGHFRKRFFPIRSRRRPRLRVTNPPASAGQVRFFRPQKPGEMEPIEISCQTAIWVKTTSERDGGPC
jgi:hypothetical protein